MEYAMRKKWKSVWFWDVLPLWSPGLSFSCWGMGCCCRQMCRILRTSGISFWQCWVSLPCACSAKRSWIGRFRSFMNWFLQWDYMYSTRLSLRFRMSLILERKVLWEKTGKTSGFGWILPCFYYVFASIWWRIRCCGCREKCALPTSGTHCWHCSVWQAKPSLIKRDWRNRPGVGVGAGQLSSLEPTCSLPFTAAELNAVQSCPHFDTRKEGFMRKDWKSPWYWICLALMVI